MSEEHRGVAKSGPTPIYSYEHISEIPDSRSPLYRIECVIDYANRPIHRNVYFVPGERLDRFFMDYHQTFEEVVDVRPVTEREREQHLDDYR